MTPLDDAALDELLARAKLNRDLDGEQIGVVIDELRARRIQATAEARLRANHTALMGLVRSEALGSGELEQALREITEVAARVLAVDGASVWRFAEDFASVACMARFQVGNTHESGTELHRSEVPSYFEAALERRVIAVRDAATDRRTAELSRVYLRARDIRGLLVAPVILDGRLFGVLCGEHLGSPRSWSSYDEQFVSALADFSVLALESHQRFQTKERLREAVEIAEQRLRTIEQQRQAIATLSAPILDVWQGILAIPIVGFVDAQGSIELTERLLARIASARARSVIVDLTGVEVIDTMTANHLLRMLRSARLLGARCVLSGISPAIAQTLVQLDVELGEVITVRDLEAALRVTLSKAGVSHVQREPQA